MVTVNSWVINRSISMLISPARAKACLVNQFFQESDALQPDWRLVLAHQANPKLPNITLEGSIKRLLIVSAIYQESFSSYAQMDTVLVKAANGDDYEAEFKFLEASYREDVDTGALQLSILEVML